MNSQRWRNATNRNLMVRFVIGMACLVAGQVALSAPLHQGLIGYWPLDEGVGDIAADAFGVEFDTGELRNSPKWLDANNAKLGNSALQFDGLEQDVLIQNSQELDVNTNAVSVSAWVNFEFFPTELIEPFGAIFDSSQDSYILYLDRGNQELRFKITDSDGTAERPGVPETLLSTETWNHVLGVYNGGEGVAKIYYNGELIDTHTNSDLTNFVRAGQVAGIGANPTVDDPDFPSVYFFPGAIDDVAVWNRPLGRAEASYLFNAGNGTAVGAANPEISFVPDVPPVEPVPPSADPVIHYAFERDLRNSGSGGPGLDGTLLDTPGVNDDPYTAGTVGQALDLRENPVSQALNGDAVSVDFELPENGSIVFDYSVDEYYNFQSLWTNSVDPNDWEMWIYDDGRVRGRVEGDAFVTFDLDNLGGAGETYQIAFTWERDDANVAVRLYVDGELRDQDLVGTWVDPGDTFFIAGGDDANHYGNGIWDEFRIFDVALSEGEIAYLFSGSNLIGDFDGNGFVSVGDLDVMTLGDPAFDITGDGIADSNDLNKMVIDIIGTWSGDSNGDGEFSSTDLVVVFQAGKYETGETAIWSQGDWNLDGFFDSSDLVTAFQHGGYETGPRVAAVVPEPGTSLLAMLTLSLTGVVRRRRSKGNGD